MPHKKPKQTDTSSTSSNTSDELINSDDNCSIYFEKHVQKSKKKNKKEKKSKKKSKTTITTITRNECKDYDKLPGQFCDYMKSVNTRFTDICTKYLTGLTMDDIKYLKPEDFICLVPSEKYSEKLLMTIMVRKYIFCDD
jgi:hypothetical protein